MKWEQIDNYRRRSKVPFGWIYERDESVTHNLLAQGRGMEEGWDWRPACCFVFDPFHRWKDE